MIVKHRRWFVCSLSESEVSTGLSDFLVVMNVAGEEVELGLGDLLLEMGLGTDGEVVIRSSGNTTFGNNLFCIFQPSCLDRFWK